MNKKIIIGVVAVLILITAAFLGIRFIENDIVKQVSTVLAENNATAKEVRYTLLDNILTLKEVQITFPSQPTAKLSLEEVVVTKPNADAFNAQMPGQPLVAEHILIKNMLSSFSLGGVQQEMDVKETNIVQWKQNIGKILELKEHGYNEAFFTALMDMTIDKISYHTYTTTSKVKIEDMLLDSTSTIGTLTINNIAPSQIKSYVVENVNVTIGQGQEKIQTQIGKFTWDHIKLPPASDIAFLVESLPQIMSNTLTSAQSMKLLTHVETAMTLFANTKLHFENIAATAYKNNKEKNLIGLQGLLLDLALDKKNYSSAKLGVGITGLDVDVEHLDLRKREEADLIALMGKVLAIDAAFNINLATDQKQSSIDVTFGVQKAGHAMGKLTFILPDDVLPKLLALGNSNLLSTSEQEILAWMLSTLLVSIETSYKDQGLLPKGLQFASKKQQVAPSDLWLMLSSQLNRELQRNLRPFGKENIEALETCIKNPGELKITLKPEHPISIKSAETVLRANPESLNVSALCTPGENIVKAAMNIGKTPLSPKSAAKTTPKAQEQNEKTVAAPVQETPSKPQQVQPVKKTPTQEKTTAPVQAESPQAAEEPIQTEKPKLQAQAPQQVEAPQARDESPALAEKPSQQAQEVKQDETPKPVDDLQQPKTPEPIEEPKPVDKPQQAAVAPVATSPPPTVTAPTVPAPTVPAPKKPGMAILIPSSKDIISLSSFAGDNTADTCLRVMVSGNSPLVAVRVEAYRGKQGSWKTKDVKTQAMGVLAVTQQDVLLNAGDASFKFDITNPQTLELYFQDNGAVADANTSIRVVFYHEDGSRAFSVLQK